MSNNVFIPRKVNNAFTPVGDEMMVKRSSEVPRKSVLHGIARYAVVVLAGLLPFFFTPYVWAGLHFDKVILALVAVGIVVISGGLSLLQHRSVSTILPMSLAFFWLLAIVAWVSGAFSGDLQDAWRGSVLDVHTAGFISLLGMVMFIPLVLQNSKKTTVNALLLFVVSVFLVLLYNALRVFLGADFATLGTFGSLDFSPLGSLNDLAIISGAVVLSSLITLVQLNLGRWSRYVMSLLVLLSLLILMITNLLSLWLITGFSSLLILMYLLSRDTLLGDRDNTPEKLVQPKTAVVVAGLVCLTSIVFVLAGDLVGSGINRLTGINYIEVRPSFGATIDVARDVYRQDALLGVGPNRFVDAWRLYHDASINSTIFWNTAFNTGSGYVPTLFVTMGVLGGLLILLFHGSFLYLGYRMLLKTNSNDNYWYFFGTASFAMATFIWITTYIYTPGVTVLLVGALFTGFTFVAAGALLPNMQRSIPLVVNRRRGFFLMSLVVIVVTGTMAVLVTSGKQYVSARMFAQSQATASSVEDFEGALARAFALYPDGRFVSTQTQIEIGRLNSLLALESPTETDQQQFATTAQQAVVSAQQGVQLDSTDPENYLLLAAVYSILSQAKIEGAVDRANEALALAKGLDPLNPGYALMAAEMEALSGNTEKARSNINDALTLKNNFTDALYLSAQLDIKEGKTDSAITTTRNIITLEPNNPTRYLQLGVLLSASSDVKGAIGAYQAALEIDPQYANAHYLLAMAYLADNNRNEALSELRKLEESNPDNEDLKKLIEQVNSGEYQTTQAGLTPPVAEKSPQDDDGRVLTDGATETDLVTPVNTVGEEGGGN